MIFCLSLTGRALPYFFMLCLLKSMKVRRRASRQRLEQLTFIIIVPCLLPLLQSMISTCSRTFMLVQGVVMIPRDMATIFYRKNPLFVSTSRTPSFSRSYHLPWPFPHHTHSGFRCLFEQVVFFSFSAPHLFCPPLYFLFLRHRE